MSLRPVDTSVRQVDASRRPFDDVVAEHGAVVLRVCRALLGPVDADDAWSETFLSALRAYPDLRHHDNVRGWLITIAHRKALDQLRAAKRAPQPTADLVEAPSTTGIPGVLADDELREAIGALPSKQRSAVVLHHLGGLPYADVGEIIDASEAAARRSAADGIATLRRTYARRTSARPANPRGAPR